jgi:hypothetical protein
VAGGADLEVVDGDDRPGCADTRYRRADEALEKATLEDAAGDRAATAGRAHRRAAADGRGEHGLLERDRGRDRQHSAELATLAVDLGPELAAARALAEVAPEVRAAQRAAAEARELLTDLGAVGLPGGTAGDQRFAGLEHECLHLVLGDAEDTPDLLVAERVHLGEHERRALVLR